MLRAEISVGASIYIFTAMTTLVLGSKPLHFQCVLRLTPLWVMRTACGDEYESTFCALVNNAWNCTQTQLTVVARRGALTEVQVSFTQCWREDGDTKTAVMKFLRKSERQP